MLKYQSFGVLLFLVCDVSTQFSSFKRTSVAQEGDVRLVGSRLLFGGRVEIYHAGQWGTVCDDGWDMNEANVVCRQLKFPRAKSVVTKELDDPKALGPIWMDDMECKGTEKYLHACTFKGWGVTDCSHKEDVVIQCEPRVETDLPTSSQTLDHSIALSEELGELFDSERLCDLSVTAQSSAAETLQITDSTTFCAHKMILSRVHAFNITMDTQKVTVEVVPKCLPHFPAFIRYLYTRKIDVVFSSVQCLHWLASQFRVEQLMRDTALLFNQIIPDDSSFETQVSIHEYAIETQDFVLQETCVRYLAWNFQNFSTSPVWTQISEDLLSNLLLRSDIVVPDELFVLEVVENWILNNVNTSLDSLAKLLSLVRFPMMPAEQLTATQMLSNFSLYGTHQSIFNDNILKALQFNVQLLTNIKSRVKMFIDDVSYQPRIYTSALWSVSLAPTVQTQSYNSYGQIVAPTMATRSYQLKRHYGGSRRAMFAPTMPTRSFNNHHNVDSRRSILAPYHSSLMFRDKTTNWLAQIFTQQYQCSNQGLRCNSLPMARLHNHGSNFPGVVFGNRLLLMCQNRYIFEVQDFKESMASISKNSTQSSTYPCPNDQYQFIFVVRPEYI
ncbi:galectin-3-binding protein B [Eucyclogobius newberryi]|uniref:galectin-3-binding protein B n=1 Tax=Eucyclogobius newberryi TaxID=166745 RepID=UPI003B5AA56E